MIMEKFNQILKRIKALINEDRLAEALDAINQLLPEINPTYLPKEELLSLAGQFYMRSGRMDLAERLCQDTDTAKKLGIDSFVLAKLYDGLAKIAFYQGKYNESLNYLDKVMTLSDDRHLYYHLGNSARINIKLGKFSKAILLLRKALDVCALEKNDIAYPRNYLSLGYALALNGEIKEGIKILSKIKLHNPEEFKTDQIIFYEYKGHLQFMLAKETGDKKMCQQAIETLNEGIEIAYDFAPNGSGMGMSKRILAEIYLYLENYEQAKQNATESFRISTDINESFEVGILYWIFAQLAKHNKDDKRVKINLQMSRKILTDIGAEYEMKRLHNHYFDS
jgi:tetratricopeptide (TPR) repeat protein